ncbi:MAG: DMT family transporter [Patescibacteria group bacterium]|nr:DMT family transporter [Patescibacteria group bacterium]
MPALGILLSFGALLSWIIGDFFIQRSTRKIGNWETLFFIGIVGFIGILPFVYKKLPALFTNQDQLVFLTILSIITLVAALFLFEGLKRGKLAVIEPVYGLELPFTIGFSYILGKEHFPLAVYVIIIVVFVGILLAATQRFHHLRFYKTIFEKGVVWAAIGSVGMGLMNYLWGVGSQTISPLITIWFVHSFLAISCLLYITFVRNGARNLLEHFRHGLSSVIPASIFDNLAWIHYGYAMTLIPISIATTISESYIAGLVFIGVIINREKIAHHQLLGIVFVVVGTGIISWWFG